MSDIVGFNEGKDFLLGQLRGATAATSVDFLLSGTAVGVGGLVVTDTLAGGVGEITGWTGGASPYARITQTVPAPSNGVITFSPITWHTDTSTNGPASVKSVVMIASSKAVFAWNLNAGGSGDAMNAASATLQVTPVFFLQNVGGS